MSSTSSTQQSELPPSPLKFTRPPAFIYKEGELYCERVPLSEVAAKYGTPLYVYSAGAVRERYQILDRAFRGVEHSISYSVKANSNLSLLRMLAKLGSGFDIVSGGELERVRLIEAQQGARTPARLRESCEESGLGLHQRAIRERGLREHERDIRARKGRLDRREIVEGQDDEVALDAPRQPQQGGSGHAAVLLH